MHIHNHIMYVTVYMKLSNNISTDQGEQLCQIILKSMDKYMALTNMDKCMQAFTHIEETHWQLTTSIDHLKRAWW